MIVTAGRNLIGRHGLFATAMVMHGVIGGMAVIMRSGGRSRGSLRRRALEASRPGRSAENEGDHEQTHTDAANDVTHGETLASGNGAA